MSLFYFLQESSKTEEAVKAAKAGKDFHSSDLSSLKTAISSLGGKTEVNDIKNLKKELEGYEEGLKNLHKVSFFFESSNLLRYLIENHDSSAYEKILPLSHIW